MCAVRKFGGCFGIFKRVVASQEGIFSDMERKKLFDERSYSKFNQSIAILLDRK